MSEKVIAGLDIGNGYVKGKVSVNGKKPLMVDLPAVISYTASNNIAKPESSEYINSLDNELDVDINSDVIDTMDRGRIFLGKRAIRSGESLREFNIDNDTVKSEDPLSTMLILSSLASSLIRDYFREKNKLPEKISCDVSLGIALPIEDYMNYRNSYKNKLMKNTHNVFVHNFEKTINIEINFITVEVMAEGGAAQYAISNLGAKFLSLALNEARSEGAKIDSAYTGEILAKAVNTIGIDIGEGTVNFPVFTDGIISIEASSSINKGYGTVLENVVKSLRNTNYSFESRKDLADFLLLEDKMPAQKRVENIVKKYLKDQIIIFVRDIMREFSSIFKKVGIRTDVIYVYGGGANAIKDVLYNTLLESVKFDESSLPVIYLDSSYSRDLNRTGLYQMATLGAKTHKMID